MTIISLIRTNLFLILEGKILKDSETLSNIGLQDSGDLYFKDLGPQVGWTTVSLI